MFDHPYFPPDQLELPLLATYASQYGSEDVLGPSGLCHSFLMTPQ